MRLRVARKLWRAMLDDAGRAPRMFRWRRAVVRLWRRGDAEVRAYYGGTMGDVKAMWNASGKELPW